MVNKVGFQLGYWWATSIGKDTYKGIEYTARLGADYVEISPSVFLNSTHKELKNLLRICRDSNLSITVNGSMMSSNANLISPDKQVNKAGLEICRRVIEGCAVLESPIWSGVMHGVWGGRPVNHPASDEIAQTRSRGLKGIQEIVKDATAHNVILCLEIVNRFEMFYLNTGNDGVDFCSAVNSPFCKLLLDTYHMSIEEDNLLDTLQYVQQKGFFGCLHVGETNRRIPVGGKSNIDWFRMGQLLKEINYSGPITLEPYVFESMHYSPAVSIWRNLMDPADLSTAEKTAKQGVDFIKHILS